MIKLKINDVEQIVTPTIFPDQTSQVWHLKDLPPSGTLNHQIFPYITWNFESEAELIQIAQLVHLLGSLEYNQTSLYIPYFPYARQDKDISNESTFAKATFLKLLSTLSVKLVSYDIHSDLWNKTYNYSADFINKEPRHFLDAIEDFVPNYIFFPDEGAYKRYSKLFPDEYNLFTVIPKFYGKKVRDQSTGNITGYDVVIPDFIKKGISRSQVLIVDDLCDMGNTFIIAAKHLREKFDVRYIGLCVSHGIFSGGKDYLLNNGIDKLYYTNSLIKNEDGYKV